jgi:sensor c-di-GMP phosphodiesterase-like protein
LGLTVIAEGVETHGQLDYVSKIECDMVQGFLFSKSLPAKEFEALLTEQKQVKEKKRPKPDRDQPATTMTSDTGSLQLV